PPRGTTAPVSPGRDRPSATAAAPPRPSSTAGACGSTTANGPSNSNASPANSGARPAARPATGTEQSPRSLSRTPDVCECASKGAGPAQKSCCQPGPVSEDG